MVRKKCFISLYRHWLIPRVFPYHSKNSCSQIEDFVGGCFPWRARVGSLANWVTNTDLIVKQPSSGLIFIWSVVGNIKYYIVSYHQKLRGYTFFCQDTTFRISKLLVYNYNFFQNTLTLYLTTQVSLIWQIIDIMPNLLMLCWTRLSLPRNI